MRIQIAVALALLAASTAACSGGGGGGPKNPEFVSDPVPFARIGILYESQLLAVDPQGKSVEYEIVTGPSGATIGADTGLVSWTPTAAQVGFHVVHVRATDNSNDEGELLWNVEVRANLPPTVYPIVVSDACVGEDVTGTFLAVDPDGDPVTLTLTQPIPGFLLAPTGTFTYTPSPEGVLLISINASDPYGGETLFEQDLLVSGLNGDVLGPRANLEIPTGPYGQINGQRIAVEADGTFWTVFNQYNAVSNRAELVLNRISSTGCNVSSNTLVSTVGGNVENSFQIKTLTGGGAVIVWNEYDPTANETTVRAQRFDAAGAAQWGVGGARVSTTVGVNEYAPALELAADGVLVSFNSSNNIRAQRLSLAGAKQWGADGVLVHSGREQDGYGHNIAVDGAGGLVVFWTATSDAIVGQRLAAADGAELWTAGGAQVADGNGTVENYLSAVRSGTDYFVMWTQSDLWNAQKVDASGAGLWGVNGVSYNGPTGYTKYYAQPYLAAAGGDLFHAWSNCSGAIVERIDGTTGNSEWQSATYSGGCFYDVGLVMDGEEAVVSWTFNDYWTFNSRGTAAQRYSPTGAKIWGQGGLFVSGGQSEFGAFVSRYEVMPALIPASNFVPGEQSVVFTWQDSRKGGNGLYLQHLEADGTPGVAIPENDD